jgi:hypothetical protein
MALIDRHVVVLGYSFHNSFAVYFYAYRLNLVLLIQIRDIAHWKSLNIALALIQRGESLPLKRDLGWNVEINSDEVALFKVPKID